MEYKMRELDQLLLDFGVDKEQFNNNDFYVSQSNFYAFSLINKWPLWEKKIVNIHGEKNSGKSHLANILISKSKALLINNGIISNDTITKIKIYETIVIDNFDTLKIEEDLIYSLFNLIDQDNKYMLILSEKPINSAKFVLKDVISRSKNCLFAEIEKPDDELIFAIILKNFSDRQINIDKKLIEFILKRIDRSYSKIHDFIYKIDELSLKKKKPINLKTIKEIL